MRKHQAARRADAEGGEDGEGGEGGTATERAERARALERMSLRHKNTSKWAKRALSRGGGGRDVATRGAISEQLALAEVRRAAFGAS